MENKNSDKIRNIALLIEYDGTHFSGWQTQKQGEKTIQESIQNALKKMVGHDVTIYGSGRTDVGVHAEGQVANFYTTNKIECYKLCFGANIELSPYISIKKAIEVDESFNSRKSAVKKIYKYRIYSSSTPNPLKDRYSMQVYKPLDICKMKEGAKAIIGEHDFSCFMASGSSVKSTVREVYSLDIEQIDNQTIISICGNSFLYNMVRIIAGTLINVGLGRIPPERIQEIIKSKNRRNAGRTAWAKGLTLQKVIYKENIFSDLDFLESKKLT